MTIMYPPPMNKIKITDYSSTQVYCLKNLFFDRVVSITS